MGYSFENALRFQWSSLTGNLNPERVSHLKNYLVGELILDAGCGGGGYVDFLVKNGFKVTGIDFFFDLLFFAKRQRNNGDFVQSNILTLPFPDKHFDCTYCFDVLEHVDDYIALRELARVTSKRIIIAVPQKDEYYGSQFGLTFSPYQDPTHLRYYSESLLRKLATSIDHNSVKIIPELPVDIENFIRSTVEFHIEAISPFEIKFLKLKYYLEEIISQKKILFDKGYFYNKSLITLTNRLLGEAKYLQIYRGYAAIIDL